MANIFVVFICQNPPLSKKIIVNRLTMTRISREPDIDDIGGVVEGEPRNAKEPNVRSAVSLVNARKRSSAGRVINHEKDCSPI